MKQSNAPLLNFSRRAVKLPGFAGARVRRGFGKVPSQTGLGDCVLIDFSKGFLAVADSPERNSSASHRFMLKFVRMLHDSMYYNADHVYIADELGQLKDKLVANAQELLDSISFYDSCTFTGILIARTEKGIKAILLHSGDSFLMRCNMQTRKVTQLTRNNFWMIGKSSRFYQIDDVLIDQSDLFLIATDGFSDLSLPAGVKKDAFILSLFQEYAVEEIPDVILEKHDFNRTNKDDVAFITLNPNMISFVDTRVLFGGTTPQEETKFQDKLTHGHYEDIYVPITKGI